MLSTGWVLPYLVRGPDLVDHGTDVLSIPAPIRVRGGEFRLESARELFEFTGGR